MRTAPHRYEILLKCWEDEADKRPTFTEIVKRYQDGHIPKAEQGGGYEEQRVEHQKKLSETSVININKDFKISTPAGMTFDVTFLSPRGVGEQDPECDIAITMPDEGCYMEMNSVSNCHARVSVLVNQAALHEYDDVARDHQEEMGAGSEGEQDGHVTTDTDHVTAGLTHSSNQKLNTSSSDYILMQAANDNISVSRARHTRH